MNTCFETKDSFGNSTLNGASLKPSSNPAIMLAVLLNGIYGDGDAVKTNGEHTAYYTEFWNVLSSDEYARLAKINTDSNTRVYDAEEFKQLIKYYNPQVTAEWLQNYIDETTSVESIIERRGM